MELLRLKKENRKINRQHVEEIKESIKTHGYLSCNPIITNANNEIIDGQHRFIACKELGVEPMILSIKDISESLMVDLNRTQRSWRMEEFINYYAVLGNPNYKILQDFIKETSLAVTPCIMILNRNKTEKIKFDNIKRGGFTVEFEKDSPEYEESLYIATVINKISKYMKLPKGNKLITDVLLSLIKTKEFDLDYFVDKASRYRGELYLCGSFSGYLNLFTRIYNLNKKGDKISLGG